MNIDDPGCACGGRSPAGSAVEAPDRAMARLAVAMADLPRVSWDEWFMLLALFVSTRSKDTYKRVGAVIANDDKVVLSLGYNGFPKGIADTPERLADRDLKNDLMQHAERNALEHMLVSVEGATLYCTRFPCHECAKSIISRGIRRVVAPQPPDLDHPRWGRSFALSQSVFTERGVEVTIMDVPGFPVSGASAKPLGGNQRRGLPVLGRRPYIPEMLAVFVLLITVPLILRILKIL